MKLHPDLAEGINLIQSQDAQSVVVQGQRWSHSVLVPSRGEVLAWSVAGADQLRAEHFDILAALPCDLVVFGSGARLRFPAPALLQSLMARRIGLETMDTAAACRTFNILAGEGRQVLAALILPA